MCHNTFKSAIIFCTIGEKRSGKNLPPIPLRNESSNPISTFHPDITALQAEFSVLVYLNDSNEVDSENTHRGISPSDAPNGLVVGEVVVVTSDAGGADLVVMDDVGGGADDCDVVVAGPRAVAGVVDDLSHGVDDAAAVGVGGSDTHAHPAGCVPAEKNRCNIQLLNVILVF